MNSDILKQWQRKIVNESVTVVITCVIIVIILLNFVYHGFHCGTIVLTSYLTGIYFWKQATSSWFLLFTSCLDSNHVVTNTLEKNADEQKPRVLIPRSVDQALEQVFCRVLNQYISNWYRHLSSDASFQSEVRTAIQHAVTAICSRTAQIKIDQLLLCKIVPVILHHAIETRYEVFNLHVALHSRKSEIFYLQNLSKHLLKYLLPQSSLSCKLYTSLLREIISKSLLLQFSDTVCNPAVLNHLMLRCFDRKYSTNCFVEDEAEDSDRVPLLQNFVNSRPMNPCYLSLRPTINDILKDEELRNTFMQHLKVYNTEYVLQFCLDVDSFNEKMLKPELDAEELDNLYKDAWDLFSVYFSKYSPNCIHFPRDLASSLRKALSKDVLKLRSTATLFEAYEYAFSLLEEYCQDFYKSAEFHHWLYGWYDKHSNDSVSLRNFCLRNVIESGHKFIKIKGVQKRNTNLEEPERNSVPQVEEMCINSQSHPVRKIDINRWKTTILAAKFKLVPDANETISVLTIRTLDENNIEWLVERSLGDLRFMHSKLIEIHEENAKTPFPLSECFTIQPEHIPVYETYLNEVMKLSSVTSSQILYKFLTSAEYANDEVGGGVNSKYEEYNNVGGEKNEKDADAEEKEEEKDEEEGEEEYNEEEEEEKEEEEGEEEAEMRFDKLFPKFTAQSPSLRKERGQNLETFVNSVILSCLPRKCDYDDVGENKPENKIHLKANGNHLNENMFNVDADTTVKIIYDNKPAKYSGKRFCSPFTLVIYVAFKIYRVRVCITKFIMTWKSAFGMIVDQFIFNVTNVFLNLFTKTCNPSYFINTVEWAVFDNDIKFNDEEMKDRMMKLLFDTKDDWLHPVYNLIFENLQDSKRNKQLFYNLADILAEELFPEMFTAAVESAIQ